MAPEASSRGGWALLIGIDTYPNFECRRQLGGCVNDIRIMKDALVRRFGFQEDRISVLTNLEATRDAILAAFDDLVQRVGENESVVVHYSGHGSQKPDGPEKDEADGYDETLVPCDSGRLPDHENRDITDDEIHAWLQRLMVRTPYITLIFDCCNSGTILREGKVRGLPREERQPGDWVPPVRGRTVYRDTQMGSKNWLRSGEGEKLVLFAACRSTEFANEILVGESPQVPHGALTYFLVQELMSPRFKGATCTEVFERLRPRLKRKCKDQNPQLEGARNRELFGQATILPMPFISILARKDDCVTLEAGATCGLARDSRWLVYAPGTRAVNDDAVRLGTLSIVSVGATTSEARVVEEVKPRAVIPGARAVEGFPRLVVDLVTPPGHRLAEDLAIAIAGSNLIVQSYPGDQVDARISLQSTRDGETWAVTDGAGSNLLAPELPCREPGALMTLLENLESVARLRMLASVTNPDSALQGLVDFEILRWAPPDRCVPPLQDENGEMLFYEGDRLVLEIRNRSSCPLYIHVLDIGLSGRVCMAYPHDGSQEWLGRNQTHRAGLREGEDFTLYLPPGFDPLPEAVRKDRETLKLIASTSPVELRLLFQSGQRYRSPWKEDWTTVERTFRLVPKA
jgi:caspase domain-containing protein